MPTPPGEGRVALDTSKEVLLCTEDTGVKSPKVAGGVKSSNEAWSVLKSFSISDTDICNFSIFNG